MINRPWIRTILTALAFGGVGFFVMVILLHPFFSGEITLPQTLHIGSLQIRYYGIVLAIAAASGYWLAMRRREQYGLTESQAEKIIAILIVTGFVGARIYHVISELPYYLHHPLQSLAVWQGGLGIFGAALGGFLALVFYKRFAKDLLRPSLWELLDWLTPSLVLGQLIGRFGNFLNYELYGLPTNLPWKMFVPLEFRLPSYEVYQFFHPLFLYEAAGSAIILVLLLRLKLKPGQLFLLWLLLYNMMRFFLEQLRLGSVIYYGIRLNAIIALVLVAVSLYFFYELSTTSNN
jgi:phosphatidylglycerol:prolipoprotein diacylglycerol transferase